MAFSVCTILFFAGWLFFTPGEREPVQSRPPPRHPWDLAWSGASRPCSRCKSIVYYGLVSWMPDSFQERGWSDESAGALLA